MTDKNVGLISKYKVERTDGKQKPGARYFVLDYVNDPIAREALALYAWIANEKGFLQLSDDLVDELARTRD